VTAERLRSLFAASKGQSIRPHPLLRVTSRAAAAKQLATSVGFFRVSVAEDAT
jgi:hypothetical protein